MSQQLTTIPSRLAHFRREAGLSVADVAKALEVDQSTVTALETDAPSAGRRASADLGPGGVTPESRSPTTTTPRAGAVEWSGDRRGSADDSADEGLDESYLSPSSAIARHPPTDSHFWGSRLAVLAVVLGKPLPTLIISGKLGGVSAESVSGRPTTGGLLKKARGDRSLDQVAIATLGLLSRDDLAKCEAGIPGFEQASRWLADWADVCGVPLASLLF